MEYDPFNFIHPHIAGFPISWIVGVFILGSLFSIGFYFIKSRELIHLAPAIIFSALIVFAIASATLQPGLAEQKNQWNEKTTEALNEYYNLNLTVNEFSKLNDSIPLNEEKISYSQPLNVQYGDAPHEFNTLVLGEEDGKYYLFEQIGAEYVEVKTAKD